MIRIDFSLNQKISPYLALAFIMVMGSMTAWFLTAEAQKVIDSSKESPIFNVQKRMQAEGVNGENIKLKIPNSK